MQTSTRPLTALSPSFKPRRASPAGYVTATFVIVLSLLPAHAPAALWDLATAPLETSGAASVKPNIFFILDDSGSMNWDFMPDWANDSVSGCTGTCLTSLRRNSGFNATYYNPTITYAPPLQYNGTARQSMNSTYTSAWTKVPYDAYGIQVEGATNNTGTNNIITFPDSSSGNTWQNLAGSAEYYTFVAGEYCDAPNLRNCVTQSAPSSTYLYPALLRWCTSSALTTCQASRIAGSYTYPKWPGQGAVQATSATSVLTLTEQNSNSKTVSSIKINGLEILSAPQSSSNMATLTTLIVNAVNNCTAAITGSCTVSGYSAEDTSTTSWWGTTYKVTISAPSSLGNITYTPVVTSTNRVSVSATALQGGLSAVSGVGSNTLTTITSGNTYTKASSRSDCAGSVCTYDEEMTNFANWWAYYHTRMQMAKSAISTAFATLDNRYRLGYMSINNSTNVGNDFLNIADITATSGGQKDLWFQKIANARPTGGTSLRSALSTAGRIYAGKLTGNQALWGGNTRVNVTDPMQYSCQRNFTLLSTDGYWNAGSSNGVQIDGTTAVGNQDGSETGAALDRLNNSNTLADVAQYYYATDIRSSTFSNTTNTAGTDVASNDVADQQQRMYTSTLGLGASGYMLYQANYATPSVTSGDFFNVKAGTLTSATTAAAGTCSWQTSGACTWPTPVGDTQTTIDDLWHTAVNGRGVFYSAKDPASLQNSLTDFLNNVTASTSSSASATTSNPNVSTGDNYLFKSTFKSALWYGELARYTLDLTTGALSQNADWSQSGTVFSDTTTQTYATPLLDNRSHTTRTIYTYNPTAGQRMDFTWAALDTAGMSSYFQIAAISSGSAPLQPLSQLCSSGANCLDATAQVNSTTAGTTTGAGGINLVNYLRGDRSNEGPDATTYYFQRTHVLGDIVDSQAVYVKAPLWSYNDTGYATFKSDNANRQGMVYVGANDGMLHAFNASSGAEEWAYIPSMLLPNLYKLADKRYAANHSNYVNATPKTGDVYFGSGSTGTWKTILVGGLGRGGRGYYALDITNPTSPSVLWEFKGSSATETGYITDADLGYTYGTPIITKLSDGTWVVIVTSGYNNVNPGSGKGIVWVLNAQTGALIKKIDTGMGSATATVAGCSAAPCPSGLSKLTAFVDSSRSNNLSLRVYGGDLYGNVWRIDLTQLTAAGGTAYVQLLATLSSDVNGVNRQPITTRPEVSYINNRPVVYIGTGAYLGASDVTTTATQTIYALKDPVATSATATTLASSSSATTPTYANPRASTCTATTNTNCFVKHALRDSAGVRTINTAASTAVNYDVDFATMNGWYADMPRTGERIDTDPDLQLGTLAFTSNTPASNDPCSSGGSSFLNYFDYKTGKAVQNSTNVGVSLSTGTTSALATAVTLIRLPNGKVVGVTNLSDGSSVTKETPVKASGTGTRRVTWRELVN